MIFRGQRRRGPGQGEDGYVLMFLLLTMALMIIFAAVIVPTIKFQIERDREEELIHRGVEYSRAIRKYFKRFGRYPARIENLESSNNYRFLRKRYKDPITGEDFKLLHIGEVKLSFGGVAPIQSPQNGAPGVTLPGTGQTSVTSGTVGAIVSPTPGTNPTQGQTTGSDSSQSSGTGSNTGTDSNDSTSGGDSGKSDGQNPAQTFGGMPIVGVVSASQKDTIREFNHKHKYNEWQFIYDPATDRGGLLMTPNQPALIQPGVQNPNTPNGTSGNTGSGTIGGLGASPSGTQNNSNAPTNGTSSPNNPPQ
jgi:type II secretory pathway pseudopilin PulG